MIEDRRRVAVIAAGMAVEGYDWVTFLALLPYMTRALVDADGSGLTVGFAIFAAGFVSRPVGAYLLGRFADRRGRTPAFVTSLWIGVGATTGMALTPVIVGVAWAAPLLLLVFRMVLGAAHGGQAAVANAYMYEIRSLQTRFDPSALVYTMAALGKVGSLTVTLLTINGLDRVDMTAWGWRIPYAVGALAGAGLALAAARGIDAEPTRPPDTVTTLSRSAVMTRMAAVVALTLGTTLTYNIWIAGTVPYAVAHLRIDESTMVATSLAQTLVFAGMVIVVGRLVRHRSRTRVHMVFALTNAALAAPLLLLTRPSTTLAMYVVGTSLATIVLAGLCATLPAVISSLFPRSIRGVGNGLPYAIAVALVGGTAPALRETLTSEYGVFSAYAVATCVVTAAAAIAIQRGSARAGGRSRSSRTMVDG